MKCISYLWYKAETQEESSQDNDPSRKHCCTQINVAPQDECNEYDHDQYNTVYVDQSSDRF